MKLNEFTPSALIDMIKVLSAAFGIGTTTDETYNQIAEYLQQEYGRIEADRIKRALHYWARNESDIRPPRFLNAKFISAILNFHKRNLDNISNDHLSRDYEKPLQFTEAQKEALKHEHMDDMRNYLRLALKGTHDHILNQRSLIIIDKQCLEDGTYDEQTYPERDIYRMRNELNIYFRDRAQYLGRTNGRLSGEIKANQVSAAFGSDGENVSFEGARAALYLDTE